MRLIDADAAARKAIICTNAVIEGDESEEMFAFMRTLQELLILAFNEAPTIEAEPVRHGEWVGKYFGQYRCSICGRTQDGFYVNNVHEFKFCPACGAFMDKEEEA